MTTGRINQIAKQDWLKVHHQPHCPLVPLASAAGIGIQHLLIQSCIKGAGDSLPQSCAIANVIGPVITMLWPHRAKIVCKQTLFDQKGVLQVTTVPQFQSSLFNCFSSLNSRCQLWSKVHSIRCNPFKKKMVPNSKLLRVSKHLCYTRSEWTVINLNLCINYTVVGCSKAYMQLFKVMFIQQVPKEETRSKIHCQD